jgi:hypothetical protein
MGWVWRALKEPPEESGPAKQDEPAEESRPANRDPQYRQAAAGDGLWLDGPPKGSPEYRAWQRWMNS